MPTSVPNMHPSLNLFAGLAGQGGAGSQLKEVQNVRTAGWNGNGKGLSEVQKGKQRAAEVGQNENGEVVSLLD